MSKHNKHFKSDSKTLPGFEPPKAPPAPNVSLSLELALNKITDAIQIPLTYKDGKVSGSATIKIAMGAVVVPVPVKATRLFYNEQLGVVFHLRGSLSLIVAHYAKTSTTAMFVIDTSKVDGKLEEIIGSTMGLKEVVALLKGAVVSSHAYKGEWSPLPMAA